MVGRHYLCDEWDNRTIRMLNTGNSNQTTRCRLQSERKENRIIQMRIGMVGLLYKPERRETRKRQN